LTNEKLSNDETSLYLEAFKFNWDKIKLDQTQRLQVLYFNIVLVIAVFSLIPHVGFPYILFPLSVVSVSSFLFYFIILKLNAEIAACFTTLQWISEKLGLIKNMREEEKENLKAELKRIGIKEIPRYAFYKEAYVNLGIPLFRRAHDVITYFSEFLTAITCSMTLSAFMYWFLASLEIGVVSLVISFVGISFYLHCLLLEKVREESIAFKKARMPEGITIWKEGREKV